MAGNGRLRLRLLLGSNYPEAPPGESTAVACVSGSAWDATTPRLRLANQQSAEVHLLIIEAAQSDLSGR
jgi:hypothetical protein